MARLFGLHGGDRVLEKSTSPFPVGADIACINIATESRLAEPTGRVHEDESMPSSVSTSPPVATPQVQPGATPESLALELDFRPLPLLRNPHVQTLLGIFLPGPVCPEPTRLHVLRLADGDGV